jgi:DNA-binding CsgD family transcriptional regulator
MAAAGKTRMQIDDSPPGPVGVEYDLQKLRARGERLRLQGNELRAEGERIRANSRRLRLECVKATLDVACTVASFADSVRCSEELSQACRGIALKTEAAVREVLTRPGWSGMERQALASRLDSLRASLAELEFGPAHNGGNGHPQEAREIPSPDDRLTIREQEVLKCIAEGLSTKALAVRLGITFKTAACHRYRLMEKLNIHDTASLVKYAIRVGTVRL